MIQVRMRLALVDEVSTGYLSEASLAIARDRELVCS